MVRRKRRDTSVNYPWTPRCTVPEVRRGMITALQLHVPLATRHTLVCLRETAYVWRLPSTTPPPPPGGGQPVAAGCPQDTDDLKARQAELLQRWALYRVCGS